MTDLKYLAAYTPDLKEQVRTMIHENRLGSFLLEKHPIVHSIANDSDLREYVMAIKTKYLKKSSSASKIIFDNKIHVVKNALGMHSYVSKVQGGKLKAKNEIRISTLFKKAPEPFLNMIVVHELAHFKEKEHNKAFYNLCVHMLPNYHQLEFELRLYLTQLEQRGEIYT